MGVVSQVKDNPDIICLQLADTLCPFHKQMVADLLVFHMHLRIRLGVSDDHFYEKLLLTLVACRKQNDQKAFLFYFMKEMEAVSGKEITDIARLLQGSLLLKKDRLKVVTLPFWKETFAGI
ncbi:hypothetical protein EDD80_10845 [Anseongella ginsenosidimutans]|uniref:Uncharacterized protein n=1 Tax=Anseongella ginsenosidimutans TaxID=496056 RepID=A0A4V2UTI3_9SPHI|nr:hypothetical protein [Anseongella ginsenosidimutans]QEC53872.1 hypothetical protein FRZ59_17085 [Anseongella ginsenosidimutans]TCS86254.1 hypothetical protein EDD80_10845 [Anseongella ginsenosidimutans]